jgi:small subunit ribosomal protein S9
MAKAASIQYVAVGRRKTSTARVKLVPGSGKILINHRQWDEYVTVPSMRSQVLLPLQTTDMAKKFDVAVNVAGGGPAGQAGAIRQGIARALLKAAPELRGTLKKQGLLTRDSRMKERKKYGQPGARKRFQFSKR